jgi:hypothetical protein
MAVIHRVLRSSCLGLIVVVLTALVGLAVPASAWADETATPSATATATATDSAPSPTPGPDEPASPPSAGSPADGPTEGPTAAGPTDGPTTAGPTDSPGADSPSADAPTIDPSASPSITATGATPTGEFTTGPSPALTLTLSCSQPEGALVWADDEVAYELVGANHSGVRLDQVTVTDDLAGVLNVATLDADPVATITHADDTTEPSAATLDETRLTWHGALEAGDTVRLSYTVTIGLVDAATTLRNLAGATWTNPDGATGTTATFEVTNPVNPVAVEGVSSGSDSGSDAGAGETLADTGVGGAASLLAFAGLMLLFGIALVAVRRRPPGDESSE